MSQKIIKLELPVVRVFLSAIVGVFLVGVFVLAWTEPGSAPPGGNVEAPVNVGASTQAKAGSFIVGGVAFEAYNDVYLSTISGRVGIGTASPLDKLEILTSDATPYSADMGSYQPEAHGLVIRNNVNLAGAGVYSGILFEAGDLGDQLMSGYIGLVDEGGVGEFTGKLVFGTRSGSDNIVERLVIDENGNVGIGTASPGAYKLNVNGDAIADTYTIVGGAILPVCNVSYRGKEFLLQGGAGTEDGFYICKKKADDSYGWAALGSPEIVTVWEDKITSVAWTTNYIPGTPFPTPNTTDATFLPSEAEILTCSGSSWAYVDFGIGSEPGWISGDLLVTGPSGFSITINSGGPFLYYSSGKASISGGGSLSAKCTGGYFIKSFDEGQFGTTYCKYSCYYVKKQ